MIRRYIENSSNPVLDMIPGVEVIGTANNGVVGLEKIASLKPELITLDLEMPELDGIGLLRDLSVRGIEVASIMISSLTEQGAKATNTALQLGAFDFVLKPIGKDPEASREQLKADLSPKIEAYIARNARLANKSRADSQRMGASDAVDRMLKSVSRCYRKPKYWVSAFQLVDLPH